MRVILVFALLSLLRVDAKTQTCPERQHERLSCYNDYSHNITCTWNSTNLPHVDNSVCCIHAEKIKDRRRTFYSSSCLLAPADISTPALKTCSLIFKQDGIFQTYHVLRISVNCSSVEISYRPYCHVKLYPPGEPMINLTTVSWVPQAAEHGGISRYTFQLEWKRKDQSWNGVSVRRVGEITCEWFCHTQLSEDSLKHGVTYEARLRVRPSDFQSSWSDWSPTASWTSSIGEASPPPSGSFALVVGITVVGTTFALFLAVLVFRTDKMTWVNTVKKITGPPLPDPGKSFLQNNWVTPHFSSDSLKTFLRPEEILPVQSVDHMDGFAPCNPELALLEKNRSKYESSGLSFFNPRYSHLWFSSSARSLTVGNLEPCAADSPYGPTVAPVLDKRLINDRDDNMENILELLMKLSQDDSCEVIPVISDYAKIETLQVDRVQTADTRAQSWEEVDGKNPEDDAGGSEEESGGKVAEGERVLQECFGPTETQGSIQVCLDYEHVHMLHDDSPELPSQDSGISGMGEEHGGQEETFEDRLMTSPFLHLSSPLSIYGAGLSLQALILESHTSSVEPSSGAYMSVCRKTPEKD
uniref:uncharacterized protein LOC131128884 n=1 Tax=Doryrhamphus excisus TaxID=161450 RepID=UPI0025AE5331|nr:uncharacterized protein LOC131128884 [Doryrhamphus excisus]